MLKRFNQPQSTDTCRIHFSINYWNGTQFSFIFFSVQFQINFHILFFLHSTINHNHISTWALWLALKLFNNNFFVDLANSISTITIAVVAPPPCSAIFSAHGDRKNHMKLLIIMAIEINCNRSRGEEWGKRRERGRKSVKEWGGKADGKCAHLHATTCLAIFTFATKFSNLFRNELN